MGRPGVLSWMRDRLLFLDGGMGTLLQANGLKSGERPETWNLLHPDAVRKAHRAYFAAGSDAVCTNTFGANLLHHDSAALTEIISAGVRLAREAAGDAANGGFVALDVGPLGRMTEPFGDLPFEEAVRLFYETVWRGADAGADFVMIETMNDLAETRAALIAAKEACDLPVFVSNAYGADGKLLTGATPEVMCAVLEGLGADVIGMNCSLGPSALSETLRRYLETAAVPVLFKPNAGLPHVADGKTVYDLDGERFALEMLPLVLEGARVIGGCCGTTPEHIRALRKAAGEIRPKEIRNRRGAVIAGMTKAMTLGDEPIVIGERINPTGKKRFQEALRAMDMAYILREGVQEEDAGAQALDVNVGMPGINEKTVLPRVVQELEAVVSLPLCIDTSDPDAMEAALRCCHGVPILNSVNGREESLNSVLPLAAKYGAVLIALTLDENGIPETPQGRLAIAERICARAEALGIPKERILFDPLTLTVSAGADAPAVTLEALRLIRDRIGCGTVLGVSNVSFGLPGREIMNSAFMVMALENGLKAAILNPKSAQMMGAFHAWRALRGLDANCGGYIGFASRVQFSAASAAQAAGVDSGTEGLSGAIGRGLRAEAEALTREAIAGGSEALSLVETEIIPALNRVGEAYEQKRAYLPQLLLAAEAAESAFSVIRSHARRDNSHGGMRVVLATVKGDVHDIGKNIVKLLLENYGYDVYDLGRDVPPERIAEEAVRLRAPLVGLSALMTTTVPAMEKTIRLLRQEAPFCRVMVGGAVLTEAYAQAIGADAYGRDAMAAVRIAQTVEREIGEDTP